MWAFFFKNLFVLTHYVLQCEHRPARAGEPDCSCRSLPGLPVLRGVESGRQDCLQVISPVHRDLGQRPLVCRRLHRSAILKALVGKIEASQRASTGGCTTL